MTEKTYTTKLIATEEYPSGPRRTYEVWQGDKKIGEVTSSMWVERRCYANSRIGYDMKPRRIYMTYDGRHYSTYPYPTLKQAAQSLIYG